MGERRKRGGIEEKKVERNEKRVGRKEKEGW